MIEERTGPVSCCVRGKSGILLRKHFDQLLKQQRPEDKTKVQEEHTARPKLVQMVPEIKSQEEATVNNEANPSERREPSRTIPTPAAETAAKIVKDLHARLRNSKLKDTKV